MERLIEWSAGHDPIRRMRVARARLQVDRSAAARDAARHLDQVARAAAVHTELCNRSRLLVGAGRAAFRMPTAPAVRRARSVRYAVGCLSAALGMTADLAEAETAAEDARSRLAVCVRRIRVLDDRRDRIDASIRRSRARAASLSEERLAIECEEHAVSARSTPSSIAADG